jgi:hypothetical protein
MQIDSTDNIGDAVGEVAAAPFVSFWDASVKVSSVSAGERTSCAIVFGAAIDAFANPARNVICWGSNNGGRLGTNDAQPYGTANPAYAMATLRPIEFPNDGHRVVQVTCGTYDTCFLFDHGRIRCLGTNYAEVLGIGTATTTIGDSRLEETCGDYIEFATTHRAIQVDVGYRSACALFGPPDEVTDATGPRRNAGVRCWGRNDEGQAGAGTASAVVTVQTLGFIEFPDDGMHPVYISNHYFTPCAIFAFPGASSGRSRCWGYNAQAQHGVGHATNLGFSASQMTGLQFTHLPDAEKDIVHLETSQTAVHHASTTGKIYAFGLNAYGDAGSVCIHLCFFLFLFPCCLPLHFFFHFYLLFSSS